MAPAKPEGKLMTVALEYYINPKTEKQAEDTIVLEDFRTKSFRTMVLACVGGGLLGTVISRKVLRPRQRIFGVIGGCLIGLPLGMPFIPVEPSLERILRLQTPLGDFVRQSAVTILPQDHPLRNLRHIPDQQELGAALYQDNQHAKRSPVTRTSEFIDDSMDMQKEPVHSRYDDFTRSYDSNYSKDLTETTFDMSGDSGVVYRDRDTDKEPRQTQSNARYTPNTGNNMNSQSAQERFNQAEANRRARLQRHPNSRPQSYDDNVMEAPRGRYDE